MQSAITRRRMDGFSFAIACDGTARTEGCQARTYTTRGVLHTRGALTGSVGFFFNLRTRLASAHLGRNDTRLHAERVPADTARRHPIILSPTPAPRPVNRTFLDNTLETWAIAGLIAVGVAVTLYAVKHLLGRRLAKLAARTSTDLDDVAAELIGETRWYFILALAVQGGTFALALTTAIERGVKQGAAVAVLLQLAVWGDTLIAYWLRKWAARRQGDTLGASTLKAIGYAAKALLWAFIVVLALRNVLNYDITALLTGLGIGGIAIALAVQNVLGDLFAALSIVLDRPFEVGDTIAVDTFTGTVEHIGLKTTRLRAVSGEQVIFSNTDLLKSRVRNLKRMQERRALITLGVTYSTPPDRAAAVPDMLRRCVASHPGTRFERAHFSRFAESWLEFELAYFVLSAEYLTFMDTQQAVNLEILRTFGQEGIEFAFPTRRIIEGKEA